MIAGENELMSSLTGIGGNSERSALQMIGLARSSWHYRHHPRQRAVNPVPQAQRVQPNALTDTERHTAEERILAAWETGNSVDHAFAAAWDEQVVVGTRRTWWRIALRLDQALRPVKPTRSRTSGKRERPELLATGPNQVWSWDITDFKGRYRGQVFKVYSIIDIFSRKIVGHRVEERESEHLAAELFEQAFAAEGAVPQWVHADSGPAMRSDTLALMLEGHGVTLTHNRPYVSNDNPYSESEFRTLKTRKHFPGTFTDLQSARGYAAAYVPWYNAEHRHTGIALFSPAQVHDGSWAEAHDDRVRAMDEYYNANPARFGHRRPTVPRPSGWSGINHPGPKPEDQTQWLQTG